MTTHPIPVYSTDEPGVRVYRLREYLRRGGQHALENHRHRFWQLIVFEEGAGHHEIDMVVHPYQAGSVVALAPGMVHRFAGRATGGRLVHFTPAHFSRAEADLAALLQLRALAAEHPVSTPPTEAFGVFSRQLSLLQEAVAWPERDAGVERAMLQALVRLVARWIPAPLRERDMIRFLARVERCYTEHQSVSAYADALGMTVRSLYAMTNRAVGRPPCQIVTDRLMLEARRRLAYSNERISQIAYALGFSDPGYFTRTFRKQVGVAPRVYRQQQGA